MLPMQLLARDGVVIKCAPTGCQAYGSGSVENNIAPATSRAVHPAGYEAGTQALAGAGDGSRCRWLFFALDGEKARTLIM
jgi:hypothetical protein